MPKIIGLAGLAHAGKDLTAKYLMFVLQDVCGHKVAIDRFATPLKDLAKIVFGYSFDDAGVKEAEVKLYRSQRIDLYNCAKAFIHKRSPFVFESDIVDAMDEAFGDDYVLSPRTLQQKFGTDVVRKFCKDAFVESLKERVEREYADYDYVIVPDVRFSNELDICDFELYVHRNVDGELDPEAEVHESEQLARDLQKQVWGDNYDGVVSHGNRSVFVIENVGNQFSLLDEVVRCVYEMDMSKMIHGNL